MSNTPKAMLVVSFGTSYNETRAKTIDAIEAAIASAWPEYRLQRAWTSQMVINNVAKRDGKLICNVEQAMDKLLGEGVAEVVVQPTHVMSGYEYEEMMNTVRGYEDRFASIKYGAPLFTSGEDYAAMVDIITSETETYSTPNTAIVMMGHGTEHPSNACYSRFQQALADKGFANYFVGTVEAEPALEDIMAAVKQSGAEKVVLMPLMIVAGDHAINDMAGADEDSWRGRFAAEGYGVSVILKGLGELEGVQRLFVQHANAAVNR